MEIVSVPPVPAWATGTAPSSVTAASPRTTVNTKRFFIRLSPLWSNTLRTRRSLNHQNLALFAGILHWTDRRCRSGHLGESAPSRHRKRAWAVPPYSRGQERSLWRAELRVL